MKPIPTGAWAVLRCAVAVGAALAVLVAASTATADRIALTLDDVPNDGLVVARVDLTAAARWCKVEVAPDRLRVLAPPGDKPLPAQFVPDSDQPTSGTLVLRCDPAQPQARVALDFSGAPPAKPAESTSVRTRWYTVVHDPKRQGGLPAEITFAASGRKFDSPRWNDRLYHRQLGQFWLREDKQPRVQCVSTGPFCTVIRMSVAYAQPNGKRPDSQPGAVYDWYYFHDQPLVHVRSIVRQQPAQEWHEAHFLELGFSTNGFSRWAGGEPRQGGPFLGKDESHRFSRWGAVSEGRDVLGLFDTGSISAYDGKGYGRYLHAHSDAAWRGWSTTRFERSAWLWIGTEDKPAEVLASLAAAPPGKARVQVSIDRLQQRIESLRTELARAKGAARSAPGWQLALTQLLGKHGRFREALDAPTAKLPPDWSVIAAGDLRLILERRQDGMPLVDLADAATGALLLGAQHQPLFDMTLRNSQTGELLGLTAERDWNEVTQDPALEANAVTLRWSKPRSDSLGDLRVTARLRADAAQHRLSLSLDAQGQASPWALWQVRFPQLVVSAGGAQAQLLLPQAAGVLKPVGRESLARFHGYYPSGWTAMQLAALYDPSAGTGLYFGVHDPAGSTKEITAENAGDSRSVRLAWDVPVPDMGRPGNRFAVSGEAVWQLLRGDWFDAALIYREWARREAKWFPRLGADGRADTPLWMRELSVWAQSGGSPKECVPQVLEFARALGAPVGFHWYNWHRIPFDNDYPHYFPAKDGFVEGVKQLQEGGVQVMPYINGRLWDTHDQGTNDFEFTRVARPAAAKNEKGEPHLESYSSKEANGDKVRLAAMCPTTTLWRDRQRDIVLRLFNECGVKGVYMDQIAAAAPVKCFDPAHGHPLGGGSWWNEQGYWPMLDRIRRDKPADRMLTTECSAEPFLRWFDGYLTWHWQYDGQVPLFPAVYGGAVQMFGRAYRGGPTKDLALRMKAAQQLVYGEQLGWINPGVVREKENFAFFRDAVQLRWNLRRYFHAGQMARPPRLAGTIPNVTADWQWSGVWPVTTPAVMTGAWHLPGEKRLVLLFANVSDQAITAPVHCDLREAGLAGERLARRKWTPQGISDAGEIGSVLDETTAFPPRSAWAWEISEKR